MDAARQQAITDCGRCHQPEDAHKYRAGEDEEAVAVLAALGGPCTHFAASDASVIYEKHLAIIDNRAPRYQPGRVGKLNPLCPKCARRHLGNCVIAPGSTPGPGTAARGAAKARAALCLTRRDDAEAS